MLALNVLNLGTDGLGGVAIIAFYMFEGAYPDHEQVLETGDDGTAPAYYSDQATVRNAAARRWWDSSG
jgi:hypothetical protein